MNAEFTTQRCVLCHILRGYTVAVFCQQPSGWMDSFKTQHKGPIHSHLSRWTSTLTNLLLSPRTWIVELILQNIFDEKLKVCLSVEAMFVYLLLWQPLNCSDFPRPYRVKCTQSNICSHCLPMCYSKLKISFLLTKALLLMLHKKYLSENKKSNVVFEGFWFCRALFL